MKRFFRSLIRNTFIAVMTSITSLVLLVILVAVMVAALSNQKPSLPSRAILALDLTMNLQDAPPTLSLEDLLLKMARDEKIPTYHLRDLIEVIERAKTDRRIQGIHLTGSFIPSGVSSSFPALHELREALMDFKASGKSLTAYTIHPRLRDLYVMSVADQMILNPAGLVEMPGLYSENIFFGDALRKYGIGVQPVRVGDYKSAIEPFTRASMSREARESSQQLLNELWIQILGHVCASRDVDPVQLNRHIQRYPILSPKEALEFGLFSSLMTQREMTDFLTDIAGYNQDRSSFANISLADYVAERDLFRQDPSGPGIAVVYAEGVIVGGYGDDDQVGAQRMVETLRRARNNPNIRAIVLRVNSPGGGATASRLIQDELLEVRNQGKPLIVSMGGYSTSGGYMLSEVADQIFCHPHTITGSIGIFGMLIHIGEAARRFGITFDDIKTAQNADIYSIARPKSLHQLNIIQNNLNSFYESWVRSVARHRNMEVADVLKVASGRTWSGFQALELGLADRNGGLTDAIRYAANEVGLQQYAVYEYPKKLNESEAISRALGFRAQMPVAPRQQTFSDLLQGWGRTLSTYLDLLQDPHHAYALCPVRY